MKPPENNREAALRTLKRQIAEQRARLDPRLLEMAAQAAALSQKPAAARQEGMVPYDRAAAAAAVRLFLQNHPDAAAFEKELLALLNIKTH